MTYIEKEQDKKKDRECFVVLFDSMSDQIDSLVEIREKFGVGDPEVLSDKGLSQRRVKGVDKDRTFQGWDDLKSHLFMPWDKGLKTYERMINQLRDEHIPPPKDLKRKSVWSDEEGEDVDLDRLQRQRPYLRTTRREHRPGPLSVTIVAVTAINCDKNAEDNIWRGAASICLTEILESAGYRVELWSAFSVNGGFDSRGDDRGWWGDQDLVVGTLLKRGMDQIDSTSMINAVSGWYFRTIGFASFWMAAKPVDCYGSKGSFGPKELEFITHDQQAIICDDVWNHSQAVTWVRDRIKELK